MARGTPREAGHALVFLLSSLAGYALGHPAELLAETLLPPALIMLAAVVGGYMASSADRLGGLLGSRGEAALPLTLAASTLAAGVAAGALGAPLLGLEPPAGAAVAAGSGWYSFTGPYLALYDPALGLLGFTSNLLREALVIAGYPLLARILGPEAAISAGGATTMDTTLPVIARHGGPRAAALALAHGGLVTLAVPLLLPALYP